MGPTVTPFFMFDDSCEEAMNFYVSLFPNSRVLRIQRYGKGEAGKEGSVLQATFSLNGREFLCVDSTVKHAFTFTPSISLFVNFDDEAKIAPVFAKLSEGGRAFMPLDNYGFSKKFGWVADRYGVSWQLNVPN